MDKILLRRTSRVLAGHNWIFSNELAASPKNHEPGALVEVFDMKKEFIGIGYINPNSLIAVRLLTRKREDIDAKFFKKRIYDALYYRKRIGIKDDAFRVIFSEGDFLPGLIADKYGECLVLQFLTFGMDKFRDTIVGLFDDILVPSVIILRNDSQSRLLEGLPLSTEVVKALSILCRSSVKARFPLGSIRWQVRKQASFSIKGEQAGAQRTYPQRDRPGPFLLFRRMGIATCR